MIQIENLKSIPSQIISRVIVAVGAMTILLLSVLLNPDQVDFLTCQFRELTRHSCPTCGLSHSLYAISHFQLLQSFHYHPMGIFVYVVLFLLFLKSTGELCFKKTIKIRLGSSMTGIAMLIILLVWLSFWILRLVTES